MPRMSGVLRSGLVLGLVVAGFAPAAGAAGGAPAAGPIGPRTLLQDTTQFDGYDVATDAAGNGYVGWISDDSATAGATRKVRLCYLPAGTSTCGNYSQIDALGVSSAAGLKVLAGPSGVTLVWFHDTVPGSVTGPRGGRIATASVVGGAVQPATDIADAPSFGQLLDAQYAPDGALWTVAYKGVGTTALEVRPGAGAAIEPVTAPYNVGKLELAFAGSTAVLAATEYGSVGTAIGTSHRTGGVWSGFSPVRNTWSVGTVGLASAGGSAHVVASIGNASYVPVVAHSSGSGFGVPTKTGDSNACSPSSHDLVSDASGRLADVSNECGQITVVNQAQRARAALFRFAAGNTVANGDPQIATTPRGYGWVAWSTQTSFGNKLQVTRVLLPALLTKATRGSAAGRVTVTGPATCLPPVGAKVGVSAGGKNGWRVTGRSLRLDGAAYSRGTVNGASFAAGSRHVLTGKATLSKGGSTVTRTVTLAFRSCPNP